VPHVAPDGDFPKMEGEPMRVQPSRAKKAEPAG
jgi:hypothetical protein